MDERHAEVSGLRVRWLESGEGRPVVLVHGIPTSAELWRHVMPQVGGARCLAWEMVGYGGSIRAGGRHDISVGAQADYLHAWMRDLGLERAVLVGHDLGGGVVHILAVRHPDACAGVVLVNSIGYDSWPIPSVRMMQKGSRLLERLPLVGFRGVFTSFVRRGHDDRVCADEAMQTHWPHYARGGGAAAFARQIRSLDVGDTLAVADGLRNLNVPARVVWGTADRFQKIEYGERFARDLRTSVTRIPGGKHFVPEDHADAVAEAVNDVVARAV